MTRTRQSTGNSLVNAQPFSLALLAAVLLVTGCGGTVGGAAPNSDEEAPATITDRSRDMEQTNDFLRLIFVPAGVKPTALGLPSALRVFVAASDFFRPALSLSETLPYPGLSNNDDQDLVALRCTPADPSKVEPILATWPNVFEKIKADFGAQYACPPQPGSPENELYCLVKDYVDTPSTTVVVGLQQALLLGGTLFADSGRAEALRRRYGVYPAFSGLGIAVKGSGGGTPLRAAETLQRSVVPEYLLKNAGLADAGCFCISVPPYAGRSASPLDVDFVVQKGALGECVSVSRLEHAQR